MSEPSIKLVAFCGSLRKGSFNRLALQAFIERLPQGTSVETIEIGDWPLYNADIQAQGFANPVQAAQQKMLAADGVVFASPEYNYSVSGVLKNAIDWASRAPNMPFDGKTGAVFGASGGVLGTARSQRDLRWIMSGLNVYMVNLPHVYVGSAAQKFADGKLTDQGARDFIKQLLENLRDLTLKLQSK